MAGMPGISDAEWEVMDVVWSLAEAAGQAGGAAGVGGATATQVVGVLEDRRDWNPKTVKTLLNRLVKKGALGYERQGKRYVYHPRVTRDACVREESRSFLGKVFAGRAGEMLCRFVSEAKLSREEIEALRRVLEKKGRE